MRIALALALLLAVAASGDETRNTFCLGGAQRDYPGGVAVDGAGNLFVVGAFEETVDFDPGPGSAPQISSGRRRTDAFVAKYDREGRFLWVTAFGGTDMDYARCVKADGEGNVLVAGHYSGTVDFEPRDERKAHDTLATRSGRNAFVAKYGPDGKLVWVRGFGDEDHATPGSKRPDVEWSEGGRDIAVDEQGNLYLVGLFRGVIDLDPGDGKVERECVSDSQDGYCVSLDKDGAYRWGFTLGGPGIDQCRAVALGPNQTVLVAGCFSETVKFGGNPTRSKGSLDAYLAWYGRDGTFQRCVAWGGYGMDQVNDGAVAMDAEGAVYAAGAFKGKLDFDSTKKKVLRSSDGTDAFLLRYRPQGELDWVIRLGAGGTDSAHDVCIDAAGNVVVTGRFQKRVDFAPGRRKKFLGAKGTAGASHAFTATYDARGKLVWARSLGADISGAVKLTRGTGLASRPDGHLIVMGTFFGKLDADPGRGKLILQGAGSSDMFVVRYDKAGQVVR
jgi:hypothetical protein